MVNQVSYARLYNVGNYENVRFEAVASVVDGNELLAYAEAKAAVHSAYAVWVVEREEFEKARREVSGFGA